MFYLFPFEKIDRGEKIILYGAGNVGQCFLGQINKTNYCELLCVTDRDWKLDRNFSVPLIAPEEVGEYKFDKIVIAVKNRLVAETIRNMLVEQYDISDEKIILGYEREIYNNGRKIYIGKRHKKGKIYVAFVMGPGLGDGIIYKPFMLEFMRNIKQAPFEADIYVSSDGRAFAEALYSDMKFVNSYVNRLQLGSKMMEYDVVIQMGYFLKILGLDLVGLKNKDSNFAEMIKKLSERIEEYGLETSRGSDNGIHYARANLLGYNCYSAYNYRDVFHITDWRVNIPLLPKYESEFQKLGLGNYLTMNYGWGNNGHDKETIPAKVWPLSYYEELVALIHDAYPNILVIQIGMDSSYKIAGVDRCVFGTNIELTKYILKNSRLHIDGEGGLVHLATQLGTKCAVLFGPTPLHYFGYKENINILSGKCHGCCHLENDFSLCLRRMERPECMYSIMPKMVMDKIDEYLQNIT